MTTLTTSTTKSNDLFEIDSQKLHVDVEDNTSSSILEFLNKEQECFNGIYDDNSEIDVESIFEEINRLSDNTDERSVDEIIREAELLISKQAFVVDGNKIDTSNNNRDLKNKNQNKFVCNENVSVNNTNRNVRNNDFRKVVDEVQPDSVISDESTPKDMNLTSFGQGKEDDGDTTDTIEEITEGIDTIHVNDINEDGVLVKSITSIYSNKLLNNSTSSTPSLILCEKRDSNNDNREKSFIQHIDNDIISSKIAINNAQNVPELHKNNDDNNSSLTNEINKSPLAVTINNTFTRPYFINKLNENLARNYSSINNNNNNNNNSNSNNNNNDNDNRTFCDRSTNSSPKNYVSVITSPIEGMSITREHALKNEIEQLQEKLKDTEERLQSLRLQHDSLSQLHRDLRDNNTQLQEQSELLKLDVQHLTECANILRSELNSARSDRNDAMELQKILHIELDESRNEKKKVLELKEKDTKIIQDLQRQCREMERILMRKHPDSVSALIVASKNPLKHNEDNSSSRRLLEQRIAQLEHDAKEQDLKAQKILANVQARFNSVQSKYETHIADLETQVLSLQEINAKLNEKIEYQIQTLNCIAAKTSGENLVNNCTQTEDIPEKDAKLLNTSTQTDNSGINSNMSGSQTARSGNKQSGLKKPSQSLIGKMPSSHSDTTIAAYQAAAKEDAHLLATIRGMRVDLAIKDKAMQRLTRELDECKKTIKKLQKEREVLKSDKPHSASSSSSMSSRKLFDPTQYTDQASDSQAIKEALNKIKLLEFDYKSLHDKRLQDLKTLQTAHERELASCHETVRILQQRLTERDEAFAVQKHRKVPVDYYALKAKVSSLERRHSEREERLHMLVEALSKGRLNGALDDILHESNK